MKIIYDTEQPAYRRVVLFNQAGEESVVGCYKIDVEISLLNHATNILQIHRWGDFKKRKLIHAEVRTALATEVQGGQG